MKTAKFLVPHATPAHLRQVRSALFAGILVLTTLFAYNGQPAWGQKKGLDFSNLGLPEIPAADKSISQSPLSYSAEYSMAQDGQNGTLRVTATVKSKWHTYSVTQPTGGPKPTVIKVVDDAVKLTGPFVPDIPATISLMDVYPGVPIEEHADRVTWTAPFAVTGKFTAGVSELAISVDGLVCSPPSTGGECRPVSQKLTAKLASQKDSKPLLTFKPKNSHADVSIYFEAGQVSPGAATAIIVHLKLDPTYHVYHFDRVNKEANFHTLIVPTVKSGLLFATAQTASPVKSLKVGSDDTYYHEDEVRWRIPVRVPETMSYGELPVQLQLAFNTCNESTCDPPSAVLADGTLSVVASVSDDQRSSFEIKSIATKEVAGQPNLASWADFKSDDESSRALAAADEAEEANSVRRAATGTLDIWTLGAALLGGFILNFMPCVLPVIGLKIFSFVEQAGSSRGEVIKLNLAYVLGILVVMWILAAITIATKNAFGWGQQFTNFEFKLILSGIVFAMALSFLGVWEIPIPGFATSSKSNELMQREGILGAFSKGVLTTILATPCSGPFLGFVFTVTLTLPPAGVLAIYTMVGIGMGLPFLVLCLRPSMVKLLPKPGAWMETLKEALAFPLLLTVVYFIGSIESEYRIAVLSTLIAVWFGCWIVGKVPAYADRSSKIRAWSAALASIALWGMLSFSMLGPTKAILPWQPYTPELLASLRESGKTVMIDFTANWCFNCQLNTKVAIERSQVAELVKRNDITPLLADWSQPSEAVEKQVMRLGGAIPLLAIYPPGTATEPIILNGTITQTQLLEALKKAGPSRVSGRLTTTKDEKSSETR